MELETLVEEVPIVTLANLPDDVIREIIRAAGDEEAESLRLISRSWNAMVIESKKRHLDTVRIETGGSQWNTKDVCVTLTMAREDMEKFQDVVKGWSMDLRASQVKSPTLHVKTIYIADQWAYFALIYSIASLLLALRIHYYGAIFLFILYMVFLGYLHYWVGPEAEKNCQRLWKLFSRTSSIRELYLVNLDRSSLRIIEETLRDVPVNHLIIVDKQFDKELRTEVLKLARTHKVGKLSLCIKRCQERKLRKFFHEASSLVKELHVYEKSQSTGDIFGQPRQFWEGAAREMTAEGLFTVEVMEGEALEGHQFRLKVLF